MRDGLTDHWAGILGLEAGQVNDWWGGPPLRVLQGAYYASCAQGIQSEGKMGAAFRIASHPRKVREDGAASFLIGV